jgi:putative transcriptional regulator
MIKVHIAKLLKDSGKTNYWLAKQAHMTQQALRRLSRGETQRIEFSTLDAICEALNCQPGDVLVHVNKKAKEDKP